MIEYFRIFASSIPIAVMFVALCASVVLLYLIVWFKTADIEDKAYRAAQAKEVSNRSVQNR